jgi:NTP pyrophosphatase (non-canonical NTP hydrolase)
MTQSGAISMNTFRLMPASITNAGYVLQSQCYGAAFAAGWHTDLVTGEPKQRNLPTSLMLIVTEIAEAMEGHRKDLMDDHLPHRKMVEVELADAVIRIFDTAGSHGYDLGGAIADKMLYNQSRADHKPAARLAEGGKKL